jgi:hypothetical protein
MRYTFAVIKVRTPWRTGSTDRDADRVIPAAITFSGGATPVRIMAALLFALAWALVHAAAPASAQVIRGRAVDDMGGARLAGVAIAAIDAAGARHAETVTDSAGEFLLHLRRSGAYVLEAFAVGHDTLRTPPVQVDIGEDVEVALRLSIRALALEPIRVVARRVENRLERDRREMRERVELQYDRATGAVLRREDVLRAPGIRLSTLLRDHLEGRTRARCTPVYYLDGIQTTPLMVAEMSITVIEAIELYRGTGVAQSRFIDAGGCGVLLIWTRELGGDARPYSWRRLVLAGGLLTAFVGLGLLLF